MVLVMAVPAEGAIALARMLYFLPSIARVRVRPVIPAFAVEYWKIHVSKGKYLAEICRCTFACPKLPSTKYVRSSYGVQFEMTYRCQFESKWLRCVHISVAGKQARQPWRTKISKSIERKIHGMN